MYSKGLLCCQPFNVFSSLCTAPYLPGCEPVLLYQERDRYRQVAGRTLFVQRNRDDAHFILIILCEMNNDLGWKWASRRCSFRPKTPLSALQLPALFCVFGANIGSDLNESCVQFEGGGHSKNAVIP